MSNGTYICGEIIQIHVGQAGVQIANACWELYCLEHGISADGSLCDCPVDNTFRNFFSFKDSCKVVPRAVLVDSEPTVVDQVRTGPYSRLYCPSSLISGKEDSGSNFARGYYTIGAELIDITMEAIRVTAESCCNLKGFLIFRSIGGGTGSGLGNLIAEQLEEEYEKVSKLEFIIFPSPSMSPLIVEPYNALLATHLGMDAMECTCILDNEALYDICASKLNIIAPKYKNLNRIIGQTASVFTTSHRFAGASNVSFAEFETNLVPYPRIHFPLLSYAPFIPGTGSGYANFTTDQITHSCFEPGNQLVRCNPADGKYMTCVLFYRGKVTTSDINCSISQLKHCDCFQFVDWSPNGFKIGMNPEPPFTVPGGGLGNSSKALVALSNNTIIQKAWCRLIAKYDRLYSRRAFIHHYLAEGLEEDSLREASEDICALISDYQEVDKAGTTNDIPVNIKYGGDREHVNGRTSRVESTPKSQEKLTTKTDRIASKSRSSGDRNTSNNKPEQPKDMPPFCNSSCTTLFKCKEKKLEDEETHPLEVALGNANGPDIPSTIAPATVICECCEFCDCCPCDPLGDPRADKGNIQPRKTVSATQQKQKTNNKMKSSSNRSLKSEDSDGNYKQLKLSLPTRSADSIDNPVPVRKSKSANALKEVTSTTTVASTRRSKSHEPARKEGERLNTYLAQQPTGGQGQGPSSSRERLVEKKLGYMNQPSSEICRELEFSSACQSVPPCMACLPCLPCPPSTRCSPCTKPCCSPRRCRPRGRCCPDEVLKLPPPRREGKEVLGEALAAKERFCNSICQPQSREKKERVCRKTLIVKQCGPDPCCNNPCCRDPCYEDGCCEDRCCEDRCCEDPCCEELIKEDHFYEDNCRQDQCCEDCCCIAPCCDPCCNQCLDPGAGCSKSSPSCSPNTDRPDNDQCCCQNREPCCCSKPEPSCRPDPCCNNNVATCAKMMWVVQPPTSSPKPKRQQCFCCAENDNLIYCSSDDKLPPMYYRQPRCRSSRLPNCFCRRYIDDSFAESCASVVPPRCAPYYVSFREEEVICCPSDDRICECYPESSMQVLRSSPARKNKKGAKDHHGNDDDDENDLRVKPRFPGV